MIKVVVAVVFWGALIGIPIAIAVIKNRGGPRFCNGPYRGSRCQMSPTVKGRCREHGRWNACNGCAGSPPSCPRCRYAKRLDEENKRRQAEEARGHKKVEHESQLFIAEFLEQGHSREAAEALAIKRQRDKPQLEQQRWAEERRLYEEREFTAGTGGNCPRCKIFVPTSGGVVLHHLVSSSNGSDYNPTYSSEPCWGIGEQAWPPGVRDSSQLPIDWPH